MKGQWMSKSTVFPLHSQAKTAESMAKACGGAKRTQRGWVALCPAHQDKTQSLSLADGQHGVLVKCWAGCTLDEICHALGLKVGELFYGRGAALARRRTPSPHPRRFDWRRMASDLEFASEFHWLKAESIFKEARQLDASSLSDKDLDQAWRCLAVGFRALRVSAHLSGAAFCLRVSGLAREKNRGLS